MTGLLVRLAHRVESRAIVWLRERIVLVDDFRPRTEERAREEPPAVPACAYSGRFGSAGAPRRHEAYYQHDYDDRVVHDVGDGPGADADDHRPDPDERAQ